MSIMSREVAHVRRGRLYENLTGLPLGGYSEPMKVVTFQVCKKALTCDGEGSYPET